MIKRVLIIGGYGNFGSFIARVLAGEENIRLIIAGRNENKAQELAGSLQSKHPAESALIDIDQELGSSLARLKPDIVIHTSGPYQGQGYKVARACIAQGCDYIDLADAREFVVNIEKLDADAKRQGVLICSGASSVPCLSSAIIDEYLAQFSRLQSLDYAIATAQKTNRGLATTKAVLSYAGRPFRSLRQGKRTKVYGWQGLRWHKFWKLNTRLLGHCDIPDLELFPKRYPDLKDIRFQAGLGLNFLHLILWAMSGLARIRLLPPLQLLAPVMLRISTLFDWIGNDTSGFYMTLGGLDQENKPRKTTFDLVAYDGEGLFIPVMPAIILAKKLINGEVEATGAQPRIGLVTLEEYLTGLKELNIKWQTIEANDVDGSI